jgi:hypothetical protein
MCRETIEIIVEIEGKPSEVLYVQPPLNHTHLFSYLEQIPGLKAYRVHRVVAPAASGHQSVALSN